MLAIVSCFCKEYVYRYMIPLHDTWIVRLKEMLDETQILMDNPRITFRFLSFFLFRNPNENSSI